MDFVPVGTIFVPSYTTKVDKTEIMTPEEFLGYTFFLASYTSHPKALLERLWTDMSDEEQKPFHFQAYEQYQKMQRQHGHGVNVGKR